MSYFDPIISRLPSGTLGHYVVSPRDARENAALQRLLLGFAAHHAGIPPADINLMPEQKELLYGTPCCDPRIPFHVLFSLGEKEAMVKPHLGGLFLPYHPINPAPPEVYRQAHLYLLWAADPDVSRNFSVASGPIRPVWVVMAHTDCGAAKKFVSAPAQWNNLPLDAGMKLEMKFRVALGAQYAQSEVRKNVSFQDYVAVQFLRRSTLYAVAALDYMIKAMLKANPDINERNPGFKEAQIIPLHHRTETTELYLVDSREDYDLTLLPLPPAGQLVRSQDVRHGRAPK